MSYDLRILTTPNTTLADDDTYLPVSVETMSKLRHCMRKTGMIAFDYDQSGMPDFAEYNEYRGIFCAHPAAAAGRTLQSWFEETGKTSPYRWRPSCGDALSGFTGPLPGIAEHKLCSNDYWVVTPPECAEALEAWRAAVRASCPFATWEDELRLAAALMAEARHLRRGGVCANVVQDDHGRLAIVPVAAESEGLVATWMTWVRFLRDAAGEEGFEVH